jgi:hypothetical protein
LTLAHTNEERFIAACERAGEVEVRQQLNAGRYGGRKVDWASQWLDRAQDGNSEAAKAVDTGRQLSPPAGSHIRGWAVTATVLGLLLAGGIAAARLW